MARGRLLPALFAAFAVFGCGAAFEVAAQDARIGEASSVQNQVTRVRGQSRLTVSAGESVFRNETIATAASSSARLTFLDQTNLAIGPSSRVVLNRFVYSGDASAQALGVNLARGAFRFSTGAMDKRAYRIESPVAQIGVRGTVLDINVQQGRTVVTLVDNGQATACTRNGRQCAQLLRPGDSVVIDSAGARRTNAGFSFAQFCAGNPTLCGSGGTQLAQGMDALCGR
ncbi:MAG: FecR domain-containing protein [Beijerinckiaceae bacterium]